MKKLIFAFFCLILIFQCLSQLETNKNNKNKENKNENEMKINPLKKSYKWEEIAELIANDGKSNDYFGYCPKILQNIIVVGSAYSTIGENEYQGKAYIFRNNGTNWNQEAELIASDGKSNDYFGYSVSIASSDIIVIGAYKSKIGNNISQGKVYIFRNDGENWNEDQILIASDGKSNDYFGYSVSIASTNTIAIGAPYAEIGNHMNQGKVYVFQNNGTNWNEYGILISSDGAKSDNFGYSVSVSSIDVIVIGAPNAMVGSNSYQGKVYMFQNNGTTWDEEEIIIASDGASYDNFGYSVATSQTEYFAVGAPYAEVGANFEQGKAYVFQNNGTTWNEDTILVGNEGASGDLFGYNLGKAYVFRRTQDIWNQDSILFASDGEAYDRFGYCVSISGEYSVSGAPYAEVGNNTQQGKAYVFEAFEVPDPVQLINCTSLFSKFGCFWYEVESLVDLQYQIIYNFTWNLVQYPILNGDVYYQEFNSSFYPDITGNQDYQIQIKACNISSSLCGQASNQWNLTTRIDSVKNFSLSSSSGESIQISWMFPDVPVIDSVPKLSNYIISYKQKSEIEPINITVSKLSTSYILHNLQSLTNYFVAIWPCRTGDCQGEDQGEIVSSSISTPFGPVLYASCSVSNIYNVFCSWTRPNASISPIYYNFTYKSSIVNDSGSFKPQSASQSFEVKFSNIDYFINISACDINDKCGTVTTIPITSGQLSAPTIDESIGKIESIELSFTKVEYSQGYIVSSDNGESWNNFSSLDLNGTNAIGIESNLAGNVEYQVCVKACSEPTCNPLFAGATSSTISIIPKLGNITSLRCFAKVCGFECSWDPLILSEGLKGYSFNYNSTLICLSNINTSQSITNLSCGSMYEISVFSSAGENCSFSNYSGVSSTAIITTLTNHKSSSSSHKKTIVIAIVVPVAVIVISIIIIAVVLIKRRISIKKKISSVINSSDENEKQNLLNDSKIN
ncbi:hypothetical protein M0811_02474 [Anaeramoeba ignava]|uniref:Fibronectin type-III domain-containing protein n=1 Tax=Anaeramoeba ignava TaxID=1746090 RepID=A0A9Q0L8U3_ANAIG|nr:hypothetical protein M0811_02474 [Anaeramoeba ignava]